MNKRPILDSISSPKDLKALDSKKLSALASEIRSFLIENIIRDGGHLASNLGTVEITLALIRALDLPNDRVIFDVGHQSYTYKLLTDRKDRFSTIRKPGGLSGFEKMSESPYDCYGTGHSSTSISAAIGFAQADRILGRNNVTVAVVGDGAFTGGLIHEALNNIDENLPIIIILNENEMSISKNIGAFAKTIAKIRSKGSYYGTKRITRKLVSSIPIFGEKAFEMMKNAKRRIKNSIFSSNYFEDLGLYYLGPADGNDLFQVENLLNEAILSQKASVIHLRTVKGKGYAPAEKNPGKYHSVSAGKKQSVCGFSEAMGKYITQKAYTDRKICAITAAMADGCGLVPFKQSHPDRFFDVGIAEAHSLIFAAGLAAGGLKPIVSLYSSFLQRGYDSILHDIALQSLSVTVMVDRASLAEKDGPTHHGIYDVSFISAIPGTEIYAPADYSSLYSITDLALEKKGPVFIRYPHSPEFPAAKKLRSAGPFLRISDNAEGDADAYIITYGRIVSEAVKASELLCAEGIHCEVLMLEKLHPLDSEAIFETTKKARVLLVLEEGIKHGGVGETLALRGALSQRSVDILAIDNSFADRDSSSSYFEFCEISAKDAYLKIKGTINNYSK